MKQRILLSAALAAFTLGFTGAASAHFGDSKLIHGCVKDTGGAVRIVGKDMNCASGEFAKRGLRATQELLVHKDPLVRRVHLVRTQL